ncbi:MAG: TetM/TetW/TetO/TetS family tetracycline resistance ribosomal protection protein [Oscillospiraceae bacterium]|nr:TetM/TetW/TetO/TetS family tetracycline resistance ribosomal protection protein [Oscillospiraceae bacterium]
MKRLVIGMIAHVDSGKTTLSEAMLYTAGEIRRLGRVDKGDAFLDTHSIERSRGITVFSKQAVMRYDGNVYTLLDTPGHADFSAETERALRVLDYAVLVISGTDGVQSHTETLWKLLRRYGVPTVIFVNKMDISAYSPSVLMGGLKSRLDNGCTDFSPIAAGQITDDFFEEIALSDERLMNIFLDTGEVPQSEIRRAISERKLFPCFFGSALKLDGVAEFLAGLDFCTEEKSYGQAFGARVYKITEEQGVRLTHMKITGGSLKPRDMVGDEKVTRIRVYSGAKYQAADEAEAGTLCAVEGLSKTRAGDGLGFEGAAEVPLLEPVMTYRLIVPDGADDHDVLTKMRKLEEEDPQLHVVWNEQSRDISVQLMGEIQLEILKTVIAQRFGLDAEFDRGRILYKETIAKTVEGAGHYEPLRHYAEVHLLLEPTERGSGLTFDSDCRTDDLDKNWQRLILTHLEEKNHIGVLTGSPITDMKITLIGGRAHLKHTEGGDFRQATYRAVRQGLRSAESVLLEPWYSFTLEIPTETAGRAMSDLQRMGGDFSPPEVSPSNVENSVISGSAPASEMTDYQSQVISYTKGRGRLSLALKGYFPCHNAEEVIAAFGYDCDGDLANTADSVFCSHGAGHTVSWDEAPAHMHIPCRGSRESSESSEAGFSDITPRQVSDYRARLAEDKELMEIFERTYGKINRDERYALHTEKTPKRPPADKKAAPIPQGPEYILVDGYNIIFAWDELKKLAEESLDLARSTLINRLCNYQGFRRCNLILVFDAYKVRGDHREVEQVCGVSVVYTKESETADTYIEKVSHELSKNHRVRVATSDGAEQIIILGNGAYRVSAEEFRREIEAVEKAIRDIIDN